MSLATAIGKITGGAAGTLIKDLGDTIGKFHFSSEEKAAIDLKLKEVENKHKEFLEQSAAEIEKAYLLDVGNARQREIEIAKDEHTPMINKIVTPVMALFIVGTTFTLWALILFRNYEPKGSESMIIGSLTTICASVISYYFGSSTGSHSKQKQLDKMQNKE